MFAAILPILLASASSRPAPFGIPMGTPAAKLHLKLTIDGKYHLVEAPRPNDLFVSYMVTAVPKAGACSIRAQSKKLETQKQAADHLTLISRQLLIYGVPVLGPFSDGVELWTMSGRVEDYMSKIWKGSLPNNLYKIESSISYDSDSTYSVVVTYTYNNYLSCLRWSSGISNSGL